MKKMKLFSGYLVSFFAGILLTLIIANSVPKANSFNFTKGLDFETAKSFFDTHYDDSWPTRSWRTRSKGVTFDPDRFLSYDTNLRSFINKSVEITSASGKTDSIKKALPNYTWMIGVYFCGEKKDFGPNQIGLNTMFVPILAKKKSDREYEVIDIFEAKKDANYPENNRKRIDGTEYTYADIYNSFYKKYDLLTSKQMQSDQNIIFNEGNMFP